MLMLREQMRKRADGVMPAMRPAMTTAGESARTALILNRLAARGGARALARTLRRQPRCTDWSLPFAGVAEMLGRDTPHGEIQAQASRHALGRVSMLNAPVAEARKVGDLGNLRGQRQAKAPA